MKKLATEIIGWYGAFAILGAYILNSFEIISATDLIYQFLNATGAVGIVIVSWIKRAYQPMALNLIWSIIGFIALLRLLF